MVETIKRIIKNVLGKTQAECKAKMAAAMEAAKGVDVSHADEYTVATWLRSWYDIYAGPLRCRIHTPHLHPRHSADAAKGCGENGQFHGTDSIRPTGKQSTGKETVSSPVLCESFRTVRCVGHGVGQS